MKNIFSILCLTMMVFSCADKEQKRYVPKSSGNINNLVVVADNQLWEDSVGEAIRDILAAPVEGLSKEEPMFSMNQMPTSVFSGFAKKNRLVLKIEKGKDAEVKIGKDTFARPQALVVVSGQTNQEIIDQLKANAVKIIDVFNKEEIKEKQRRISKSLFKDEPIENQLGLSMKFPTAYRIAKHDNDFFWLRRDIETGTVDIMLYEVPLSSIRENDSTVLDVVRVRDSVGKIHIEGPIEGSYMGTEDAFTPFISKSIIDNKPAFETKGLWDVKNAFMSGPFINYAIEDKVNNRYIIAEGYVFAPSVTKRDYVFELEAIINSIQIK
ncbi:DUF4837 family protein [Psychroserpens sp.]|uniref:DUF4837 family protein n=1 Tax=Psychroserpens sp. TaxID=2020870 RepID=UPI001B12E361|nr:DUF4837 family protein [Psychroserpens sp.]MBO6605370.1 DUF4837 family protein [Psychroserpens sp.]MBO6630505.1 DUF4837 family protein [Psychroserpens sp.]MBO6653821.1 DUF4837 family protein [Psychroserpens sp.]MBO6682142.1 DUF4837 family protein [Psychroserpens sp.]MBO6748744.1 DUF4837 family protein [Psychroserpens sp.]